MNNIKFIYFDFGGVFFNWHSEFKTAAKDFGVKREQIAEIFNEVEEEVTRGQMTTSEFWDLCQTRLSLKNGKDYNFAKSWTLDYVPIKPTHNLAIFLSKYYQVGGLSNLYDVVSDLIFTYNRVPNIDFNPMLFSYEVGLLKPEIEIFKLAQEKAKVNSEEILLIDDSKTNCDVAKSLGWNVYQFDTYNPEKSIQEIQQLFKLQTP